MTTQTCFDRRFRFSPGGVLPPTRRDRMELLPEDPYEDVSAQHRKMLDKLGALEDEFFKLYGDGTEFYKLLADYIRAHPAEFFKS